jgi:predicted dehydrogenase
LPEPVRIAFAGGGMVSEMHAAAIEAVPGAELVGVLDANRARAEARARAWSCRAYHDLRELFGDAAVEAVFVLTPTASHVEVARAALDAGKHVLVEKPVARGMDELTGLLACAERAGTVCMPGHNYAYVPEIARLRRLVRAGRLGEVRLLSVVFAIAHTEEVAAHYDGVLRLVLPHHAYLAHGILGAPARVQAGVTATGWRDLDHDDQCWAALDYPPRATALLFASLAVDDDSADPWTFVVKALGTEGSATATWRAGVWRSSIGSMATGYAPYEEAYERQLEAFCHAVRGDRTAILSGLGDALGAERILAAAEQAVRTRASVELV